MGVPPWAPFNRRIRKDGGLRDDSGSTGENKPKMGESVLHHIFVRFHFLYYGVFGVWSGDD